jgi:Protein of unknown function (DUF2283)
MGQLIIPDGAIVHCQTYDGEADVLYIDFYNLPKSSDNSELTDDDIVIRYDDRSMNYLTVCTVKTCGGVESAG